MISLTILSFVFLASQSLVGVSNAAAAAAPGPGRFSLDRKKCFTRPKPLNESVADCWTSTHQIQETILNKLSVKKEVIPIST